MNDIKKYPLALQLLMQTDGTVTELIKLLANEDIKVVKLAEKIDYKSEQKVLYRHIYLQGIHSQTNWLYAQSKIFLDNLTSDFVNDLLHESIPIGSLWIKYRIETFKQVIEKLEAVSLGLDQAGFNKGTKVLSRTYQVYNKSAIIMEIKENFPIYEYENLIMQNVH